MQRRDFLKASGALAGAALIPYTQSSAAASLSEPGWRIFEVTTKVDLAPAGVTRAWLPLPAVREADWIVPMGNLWQGNADDMHVMRDGKYGAEMLYAEWGYDNKSPAALEVVSRFAARDRHIDLGRPRKAMPLDAASTLLYTQPTRLLPTDGIVLETARKITLSARGDYEKALAIYEWVVENTFRNPKTQGCGLGDIKFMLETGDLSGKCADLNALYVGLARAAGLPARDVYGVRVTESRLGFKSLGKSGDISKSQHCRAEVYLNEFGWVPVDPADVRKVALEEPPGGLSLADEPVNKARKLLFGAWEMNWLAYNYAHDLTLPSAIGPEVPFLMYPQAELDGKRLNSLDAAKFKYQLTSRELTA